MTLRIHNTFAKAIEEFRPLRPGVLGMYNCGPTVYSDPHIGNFRSFLMADLLRRTFDHRGYRVTQVMNITDVGHLTTDDLADAQGEDKLERSARERGVDPWQIARHYEQVFFSNLDTLGMKRAHRFPRASEHVPEMLEMIGRMVANGCAYAVPDVGVYFRVNRFPSYGALSGNTQEQLDAGARIAVDERKESPNDFALWKIDPKHLMQWESPWGRGFPGWHIECSAMSRKYLGDTFDIHTGGEDNIFPHHECERAQSLCSTDGEFARYWVHARHLLVDGAKMSKSAGNFHTIQDLLDRGYTGPEIRHSLIASHYRQQANFTLEGIEGSRSALRRLGDSRDRMEATARAGSGGDVRPRFQEEVARWQARVEESLDDDINISGVLAAVFDGVRESNRETLCAKEAELVLAWLRSADEVLGLVFQERKGLSADEEGWIAERDRARLARDFGRADELRQRLLARGIEVLDSPGGTRWKRR